MLQREVRISMESEWPNIILWLRARSYSSEEAREVVSKLINHTSLWQALLSMVHSGKEPTDLRVDDITYESLRKHEWVTPVNALLILAWVNTDPIPARKAISRGLRIR